MASSAENNADLIQFLTLQNEHARGKVSSFSATIHLAKSIKTVSEEQQGTMMQEGENVWAEHSFKQDNPMPTAANVQVMDTGTFRAVANDMYIASWAVGTGSALQFDHESLALLSLRDRGIRLESRRQIDITKYGFGNGDLAFREIISEGPSYSTWEVQSVGQGDDARYELRRFYVVDGKKGRLVSEHVIDPNRGYLLTASKYYGSDQKLGAFVAVDANEVAPGIWMPVAVTRTQYAGWPKHIDASVVDLGITAQIEYESINQDIPDEQFTLSALKMPAGTDIIRQTVDGQHMFSTWYDGNIIPFEVSQLIKTEQRDAMELQGLTSGKPAEFENITPDNGDTTEHAGPTPEQVGSDGSSAFWYALVALAVLITSTALFIWNKRRCE
jgi:hypothetical protein